MRYNKIRKMDISNGPGIRVSLFTQGCNFHCKDCFNSITWDLNGGQEFTDTEIELLINLCNYSNIEGLSILGGEPLLKENYAMLLKLVCQFKMKYNNKTIWLWTGNIMEQLLTSDDLVLKEIFKYIDVIVDGPFINVKKDITLKYRGSSNQRIIDMKETLKHNKVVLYKGVK